MSGFKPISNSSQRGQAAVMVMLFMTILVVSALTMFKMGKLTSNKMQLQNAADAAAYSMSTVEARDMNFTSYINRAIVANEVAIGQSVGLASWAYHFNSFAQYLDLYDKLLFSPITLGISTGPISTITGIWKTGGGIAINAMKTLSKVLTSVLHVINKIYGMASTILHIVSIISSIGVLDDTITQNGPPGAKLSDFGIVSLIAHIATLGLHPSLPGDQFTTVNSAGGIPGYAATTVDLADYGSTEDSSGDYDGGYGYARLQALIQDSRDPFSMHRGNDPFCLFCTAQEEADGRPGWELRAFPPIDFTDEDHRFNTNNKDNSIKIPIIPKIDLALYSIEVWAKVEFFLDLSLERKGGTEMRFVLPTSGNVTAGNINWSAADATGLFLKIALALAIQGEQCIFISGCDTFDILSADLSFGDSTLEMSASFFGIDIPLFSIPAPTGVPFAAGFAEVGKTDNNLKTRHMNLSGLGGVVDINDYGEAPNNMAAWVFSLPPTGPYGPLLSSDVPLQNTLGNRVNTTYSGLPYYVDSNSGHEPFMGVGAPNLIIGLVQDDVDFDSTSTGEPTGRFALTNNMADDELAVIAKSELYFARPTDRFAVHFHRGDGYTETGNAFNPYWQARLIETEYADRILALLIQQKQDFANLGQSFTTIFGSLLSYLP